MYVDIWIVIVVVVIGIYVLCVVLLLWIQCYFNKYKVNNIEVCLFMWLSVLGLLMIVVMLGVLFILKVLLVVSWIVIVIGIVVIVFVWCKFKSLGLLVFCGVFFFGVVFGIVLVQCWVQMLSCWVKIYFYLRFFCFKFFLSVGYVYSFIGRIYSEWDFFYKNFDG